MKKSIEFLTNNQLKILAIIAMTCDHVGKELFPDIIILQIFGRLAFPIFSYMIAEGCRYTKNRKRYLISMVSLAAICQVVFYFAMQSLYMCVLVTFSLSIAFIYTIDACCKKKTAASYFTCVLTFGVILLCTEILPKATNTDFAVDYGFWGVMLSVLVFMAESKKQKLIMTAVSLVFMSLVYGGIQWYSLFALVPLALYNGERGKLKMKNFFYIYYPLHLAVIYLISLL